MVEGDSESEKEEYSILYIIIFNSYVNDGGNFCIG